MSLRDEAEALCAADGPTFRGVVSRLVDALDGEARAEVEDLLYGEPLVGHKWAAAALMNRYSDHEALRGEVITPDKVMTHRRIARRNGAR